MKDGPKDECMVYAKNGVVDLGKLAAGGALVDAFRPYSADLAPPPNALNVDFDPDAECPRFKSFLQEVFPMQGDKAELLMKFAGYTLLRHCGYGRAAVLLGSGANGKSTFVNTLFHILGRPNTLELHINDLAVEFNIPLLQHKLLATIDDLSMMKPSACSALKKCIDGELVTARVKYGGPISFFPTVKFIMMLNQSPMLPAAQFQSLLKRILIIEFPHCFTASYRDPDLLGKLKAEAPGIFLLMLGGAIALMKDGGFE